MTALVLGWEIFYGGLSEGEIAALFGVAFVGFVVGLVLVPIVQGLFGGAGIGSLMHAVFLIVMVAIFAAIFGNFAQVLGRGFGESVRGVLSNFPFSFVFAGAFATLNGLFLYLMKAPTALGRPIMDQLAGFKLYLETAESDRLNIHAPDITADRFEALLPYAVALDVEKPWSKAFAAALARAHPGRRRPDAPLRAGLVQRRLLVERRFRRFGGVDRRQRQQRVFQCHPGVVRLVRFLRRRRFGRRRGWRRAAVAADPKVAPVPPSRSPLGGQARSKRSCAKSGHGDRGNAQQVGDVRGGNRFAEHAIAARAAAGGREREAFRRQAGFAENDGHAQAEGRVAQHGGGDLDSQREPVRPAGRRVAGGTQQSHRRGNVRPARAARPRVEADDAPGSGIDHRQVLDGGVDAARGIGGHGAQRGRGGLCKALIWPR